MRISVAGHHYANKVRGQAVVLVLLLQPRCPSCDNAYPRPGFVPRDIGSILLRSSIYLGGSFC